MGKVKVTAKTKAKVNKAPRKPRGGDSSWITAKTVATFKKKN